MSCQGLGVGTRVRSRRTGKVGTVTGEVATLRTVNVLWDVPGSVSWAYNMEKTRHSSNVNPTDIEPLTGRSA